MQNLQIILPTIFIVLLTLDYLSNLTKKTSFQIVNEMGIGYNLANSFDSYDYYQEITNADDAITLFGNPIPTKKLIANIKKYGFKTIRFPVTWAYFIDEYGNIDPEWILRVKEVVKWIIEKNIYCILNVYSDTKFWLTGIESKNKYINLWKQIAEEFKDFNGFLIFESMNEPLFLSFFNYNYDALFDFSQSFIDTIRNSEQYNKERLLIISGMSSNFELTTSPQFKIPIDPANRLAISIKYYIPTEFATNEAYWFNNKDYWGTSDDYKILLDNFVTLKNIFISKGIPVVIGEVGVVTEKSKELKSIREYLCSVFSLSIEYKGIMACLWDTSNKDFGDMNYYNRLNDEWYDNKIKNILMKISKGNIVKSSDFYIYTNLETLINIEQNYYLTITFGTKKPLRIIINICCGGKLYYDYYFDLYSMDAGRWRHSIDFDETNSKRNYDGTITYTINLRDIDCNEYFDIYNYYGEVYIKNITIEYQENFNSFYYDDYKAKIINEINEIN